MSSVFPKRSSSGRPFVFLTFLLFFVTSSVSGIGVVFYVSKVLITTIVVI